MQGRATRKSWKHLLAASVLLAACGTPSATGRGAPSHYSQAADSATNTCLRNPACYTRPAGEEAVLPWLTRAQDAANTAVAVLRLLDAAQLALVERILADCANQASFEVNERMLGPGKRPTRELCQEVVGKDSRGSEVTRAMELGREKHRVALQCAQEELAKQIPDQFSLEPRYQYDPSTGRLRLLDPKLVEEWLRNGLLDKLLGTLVPDVVLHASGNPLKVQAVYDFKFPCPQDKNPSWSNYPPKHPYEGSNQGEMYRKALGGGEPARVSPGRGVVR